MPEWKEEIRKRLVDLKLPPAREAEIQEELAQHLEERYQELLADGITERAAYQTALGELNDDSFLARELGPLERPVTHEPVILGARNKASFLRDTWRDLRYGARVLAKSPGFTLAAILTLALGIGANSAIFSLVNCILLDPLPYSQPGRLVSVWQSYAPPGVLEALRKQARTMELAAFSRASGFNFTAETTERLDGCTVSANLFALLGARPELGRTFRPGEDQPGQDQVVILSHALWQHRFGGDAGVIGRPIEIDGIKRQIVGVMPASFQLPSAAIQLWLPMHLDPTDVGGYWGGWSYPIIGRLKANVTVDQAQAEFKVLVPGIVKLFPWQMPNQWGQENHVIPSLAATDGRGGTLQALHPARSSRSHPADRLREYSQSHARSGGRSPEGSRRPRRSRRQSLKNRSASLDREPAARHRRRGRGSGICHEGSGRA